MHCLRIAGACLLTVSAFGQEADPATASPSEAPWKLFWKDGLRAESPDGDFWFRIGGRLNQDWSSFGTTGLVDEDGDPLKSGVMIRRARLQLDGLAYGTVRYRAHYEFAGAEVKFRDLWGEWTEIPLRIGYFREPLGLEANTSSNALTFLERSLPSLALTPGRNAGLMYRGKFAEERALFAVGAFRAVDQASNGSGQDVSVTGRLSWLPYTQDDGRQLVHVGLAASHRVTRDDGIPLQARLESFTAAPLIDTRVSADVARTVGAEFACVSGPYSFQTELMGMDTDGSGSEDARLWGTYAQVSWFPTGEHRPYNHGRHAFGTVTPIRNFSRKDGGHGAWELAARWSKVDLADIPTVGTLIESATFGTNWYLNPSVRIQFNWIHSMRDTFSGNEDQFYLRFQLTF